MKSNLVEHGVDASIVRQIIVSAAFPIATAGLRRGKRNNGSLVSDILG